LWYAPAVDPIEEEEKEEEDEEEVPVNNVKLCAGM
jgi:hypothetical protein